MVTDTGIAQCLQTAQCQRHFVHQPVLRCDSLATGRLTDPQFLFLLINQLVGSMYVESNVNYIVMY
jgi:hypothetical protein